MEYLAQQIHISLAKIGNLVGWNPLVRAEVDHINNCMSFAGNQYAQQKYLLDRVPQDVRDLMAVNVRLSSELAAKNCELAALKAAATGELAAKDREIAALKAATNKCLIKDREIASLKATIAHKDDNIATVKRLAKLTEIQLKENEDNLVAKLTAEAKLAAENKTAKLVAGMQSGMDKATAKLAADHAEKIKSLAAEHAENIKSLEDKLNKANAKFADRVAADVESKKVLQKRIDELQKETRTLKDNYEKSLGRVIGTQKDTKAQLNELKRARGASALAEGARFKSPIDDLLSEYPLPSLNGPYGH
jgi:chromosome segregation ATPase